MKKLILENISKLPSSFNRFFMILNQFPRLVYGSDYIKLSNKLKTEKYYNNEADLIKLINFCINEVPFYKKYKKVNSITEFKQQFDFINKEIVSDHFEDFKANSLDDNKFEIVTTGGTGGNPLKLLVPKNRYIVEPAVMHGMWNRVGFNHHTRAVIRNQKIDNRKDYVINPITKEVIFDWFRLNEVYFLKIYDVIKKFKIQYIHAYPSAAYEFSKVLYKHNLDVSFIKSFLSGSENIYKYQKNFIENQLKIPFYNWYGHSEKLVLGGYCKGTDHYHIESRYGYFELIDENGKPINTPGEIGEIVGTTINNFGMPLIRYRTDDFAEYVGEYCDICKKKGVLIKNIQGRWSGNKIYGADGSA